MQIRDTLQWVLDTVFYICLKLPINHSMQKKVLNNGRFSPVMLEYVRYREKASLQEGEALLFRVVPQQPGQRFRQPYLSPVT
jgi:hypothetical protein